jgi:hypothetical protein
MKKPSPGTPQRVEWMAHAILTVARILGRPPREVSRRDMQEQGHHVPMFVRSDVDIGGFVDARERAHILAGSPAASPWTGHTVAVSAPIPASPPPDPIGAMIERDRLREAGERERELMREIARLRADLETSRSIAANAPPPSVQPRERLYGVREAALLVCASDWHVEEYVDPAKIGGVNAYDLAIAERSAQRFFNAVVWLLDHHHGHFAVRDLVLWLGGDLIGGYIHDELVETNQLAPLPATRFAHELIASGIRMLLAETSLERIVVPCSYGNHGRTTVKPRVSSGAENSYEQHLYHALASDFADEPRVVFHVARGPLLYLDVYDWTVRFTHGDAVKYSGGVGGISIPINKAIAGWDTTRRAHLTVMGHWHQYLSAQRALVNGSLIGHAPFSDWIKAQHEPARQAACLIDRRRGVCMSTPIWVRDDDHDHVLRPAESDAIRQRVLGGRSEAA